jgi:hypothetical protein
MLIKKILYLFSFTFFRGWRFVHFIELFKEPVFDFVYFSIVFPFSILLISGLTFTSLGSNLICLLWLLPGEI